MSSLFDSDGGRKYLNANERQAFYEAAQAVSCPARRSLCLTLYYTGCRISEALALTADGIDRAEETLVFRTLKQRGNRRYRAIPVPVELLDLLERQAAGADGELLWNCARSTAWSYVKACMAEAGLSGAKACPKGLRHGFAIAALANDVPLPTIQRWLGHTLLSTTGIYTQVVGDDERALAARMWGTKAHTDV